MFWKNWLQPSQKKEYPAFWETYLAHFQSDIPKSSLLADLEFVVFDTETTGFDLYKDKILSIGAVTIKQGEIDVANAFECYVKQQFDDKGSVAIHGIMPQHQHDTLTEEEAIAAFLEYTENKILVGHHVGFDVAMLNQYIQKNVGEKLKNYAFDTAMLYHRLKYPLQQAPHPNEDYTLDTLSGHFNISVSDRHTAAGDAFITAILFLKLLDQFQKQGIKTFGDLLKR
jgi:DNA polymerase III subunit epsilon